MSYFTCKYKLKKLLRSLHLYAQYFDLLDNNQSMARFLNTKYAMETL